MKHCCRLFLRINVSPQLGQDTKVPSETSLSLPSSLNMQKSVIIMARVYHTISKTEWTLKSNFYLRFIFTKCSSRKSWKPGRHAVKVDWYQKEKHRQYWTITCLFEEVHRREGTDRQDYPVIHWENLCVSVEVHWQAEALVHSNRMELNRRVYTATHYWHRKIGIASNYIPNYTDVFPGLKIPNLN